MRASLDHRYVDINEDSPQKQFTIRNKGPKPLRILSVSSANASGVFSYDPELTSLVGTVIEPDEGIAIQSTARIDRAGQHNDTLTILTEGLAEDPNPDRSSLWSGSGRIDIVVYGTDATMEVYKKSGNVKILVSSINFGKMTYGSPQTMRLYISKKSGKYPLNVSSVSVTNSTALGWSTTASLAGIVSDFSRVPCAIAKNGDVVAYDFTFTPLLPSADYGAEIRITSNAGGATEDFVVPVDGSMDVGNLSIYPPGQSEIATYNFGTVSDGSTKTVNIILENNGGYPLSVTDVRIASTAMGGSYSKGNNEARFEVTSSSKPFTINPGSSNVVQLRAVNPTSVGSGATAYATAYLYVNGTGGTFKTITVLAGFRA